MCWRPRGGLLVLAMMMAAPVVAQVTPAPAPSPPTGTGAGAGASLPVPPPPVIVIPQATPTPAASRSPAAATPRPTSTPRAAASPAARASRLDPPTATPTPEESKSAAPDAEATPVTPPSQTPPPAPTASPAPTAAPAAAPAAREGSAFAAYWPVAAGVAAVALLALGWVLLRRRREARWQEADEPDAVFPPDFPPAGRARLTLAFRPIRAGLNLLSATSENEITVTNTGDAPAEDIRLLASMVSAHTGQDAELAAIYAAPIGRPATPAFTLQPGEQRVLTTVTALPRDAIRALDAGGRPMFVPIVAVNLIYTSEGEDRQLAQAFAVGVERVDSPKLAPFWLDAPARTFDQVAARPHATALER